MHEQFLRTEMVLGQPALELLPFQGVLDMTYDKPSFSRYYRLFTL